MWVVGGEQQPIPANPPHDIEEGAAVLWLLPLLRRPPHLLAGVLRGPLLLGGALPSPPRAELVEAPRERRQPTEAPLDQDHLEPWKSFEPSFDDQAGDRRLARGGVPCALLDVIGRPAGSRIRMAA